MAWWSLVITDHLWRNALAAIPLALLVAAICRWLPCRPTTRHTLWLIVLLWFIGAPLLPALSIPAVPRVSDEVSTTDPVPVALASEKREPIEEPRRPQTTPGEKDQDLAAAIDTQPQGDPPAPIASDNRPTFVTARKQGPAAGEYDNLPHMRKGTADAARRPRTFASKEKKTARERRDPTNVPPLELRELSLPSENESATRLELRTRDSRQQAPSVSPAVENSHRPNPAVDGRYSGKLLILDDWHVPALADLDPTPTGHKTEAYSNQISGSPNEATDESKVEAGRSADANWRRWIASLVAIRDAVGRLPALPAGIWLGGAALFVLITACRIAAYRYSLRSAVPAPEPIRSLVSAAAKEIGLRRTPDTWVVPTRSSPLIWCGWRTRLVLPADLWDQLDDIGRRAVVLHELAHLARRDHWVCWLELVVAAAYWWHPLVWWARHRLHEEADLCCDAWVTWILPRARRAYAEALITTKRYLSDSFRPVPAAGIGAISPRTQRLARRIRSVMIDNVAPRRSMTAMITATAIAIAGWVATPAESSLASTATNLAAASAAAVDSDGNPVVVTSQPRQEKVPEASAAPKPEERDIRERLARLETQMDRLSRNIREIAEMAATKSAAEPADVIWSPNAASASTPFALPVTEHANLFAGAIVPSSQQERIVRTYVLPEGKLKALSALLARADVPVLVRPQKDHIAIEATPAQHAVVAAFINLIHPPDEPAATAPQPSSFFAPLPFEATGLEEHTSADITYEPFDSTRFFLQEQLRETELESQQYEERALALQRRARDLEHRAGVLASEAANLAQEADQLAERAERREKGAMKLYGPERKRAIAQLKAICDRVCELRDRSKLIEGRARQFQEQAQQYDLLADKDLAESQRLEQRIAELTERIRTAGEEPSNLRP